MPKGLIALVFLSLLVTDASAQDAPYRRLTTEQFDRVQACKRLFEGADRKSLDTTIAALENAPYAEQNLQIMEAAAKAFADIVKELKIDPAARGRKESLYDMIMLNIAYLQFGGQGGGGGEKEPLHRLIRNKLRDYLPPDLLRDPEMFYSEGWMD